MMWNSELNERYGYNWDYETIETGKGRLLKLLERTQNYRDRFKKKRLTMEYGCYNMLLTKVELTEEYELLFYCEDDGIEKVFQEITLENMIQKDYVFKYDRKYHVLTLA